MRFLRNNMPFLMLGITFLFTILELFPFYEYIYVYLGDLFGYSLTTNLFMYLFYFNKRFCSSIKMAVIGLSLMNIFSLVSIGFEFYSVIYNLILEAIIITVVVNHIIRSK